MYDPSGTPPNMGMSPIQGGQMSGPPRPMGAPPPQGMVPFAPPPMAPPSPGGGMQALPPMGAPPPVGSPVGLPTGLGGFGGNSMGRSKFSKYLQGVKGSVGRSAPRSTSSQPNSQPNSVRPNPVVGAGGSVPRPRPVAGGIGSAGAELLRSGVPARMASGGSVPRETMIADQPHMLAYINPREERLLRGLGGSGEAGPGGVPAYPDYGDSSGFSYSGGGSQGSTGYKDVSKISNKRDDDDPVVAAAQVMANLNSNTFISSAAEDYENMTDAQKGTGSQQPMPEGYVERFGVPGADLVEVGSFSVDDSGGVRYVDSSGNIQGVADNTYKRGGDFGAVGGDLDTYLNSIGHVQGSAYNDLSGSGPKGPVLEMDPLHSIPPINVHSIYERPTEDADMGNAMAAAVAVDSGAYFPDPERDALNAITSYGDPALADPSYGLGVQEPNNRMSIDETMARYGDYTGGDPALTDPSYGLGDIAAGTYFDTAKPVTSLPISTEEDDVFVDNSVFTPEENVNRIAARFGVDSPITSTTPTAAELAAFERQEEIDSGETYLHPPENGYQLEAFTGDTTGTGTDLTGASIADLFDSTPGMQEYLAGLEETGLAGGDSASAIPESGMNYQTLAEQGSMLGPDYNQTGVGPRPLPEDDLFTSSSSLGPYSSGPTTPRGGGREASSNIALDSIKARVSEVEGTSDAGGYDRLLGFSENERFKDMKPLTEMTVAEAIAFGTSDRYKDFSREVLNRGADDLPSTPMGKYQILGSTLKGLVESGDVDPNALFDEATQEKLGTHLIERRGFGNDNVSQDQFVENLGQEFAGIKKHGYEYSGPRFEGDTSGAAGTAQQSAIGAISPQNSFTDNKAAIGEQLEGVIAPNVFEKVVAGLADFFIPFVGEGISENILNEEGRTALVNQHLDALKNGATPQFDEKGEYTGFDLSTMGTFADKLLASDDILSFMPPSATSTDYTVTQENIDDIARINQEYGGANSTSIGSKVDTDSGNSGDATSSDYSDIFAQDDGSSLGLGDVLQTGDFTNDAYLADADGDGVDDSDRFSQVFEAQSTAADADPTGMSTEQGFITSGGKTYFVTASGNVVPVNTDDYDWAKDEGKQIVDFDRSGGLKTESIFDDPIIDNDNDDDDVVCPAGFERINGECVPIVVDKPRPGLPPIIRPIDGGGGGGSLPGLPGSSVPGLKVPGVKQFAGGGMVSPGLANAADNFLAALTGS